MKNDELVERLLNVSFMRLPHPVNFRKSIDYFWNETGEYELYSFDEQQMKYTRLTESLGTMWAVRSRDGKTVYFNKDKDGNEIFSAYKLTLETKEVEPIVQHTKHNNSFIALSPNEKSVLLYSNKNGMMNLVRVDLETEKVTQITNHKNPLYGRVFWGTDNWIYYSANDTENRLNKDIWRVKADGSKNELFYSYSQKSKEFIANISTDGTKLLIETSGPDAKIAGVLNTSNKKILWIGDQTIDTQPLEFSSDGKRVLTIRFQGIQRIPMVYNLETQKEQDLDLKGTVFQAYFSEDDKGVICTFSNPKTPMSLLLYDLQSSTSKILIQSEIGIPKEKILGAKDIRYPSFDGLEIPAVLYKPVIQEGEKMPALIHVPGGPGGQFSLIFEPFSQLLAQKGFVILGPSIRGSIGFGSDYFKKNIMDLGGGDAMDVVYGKKYLESLEYVDNSRIGVFGGSYGGYMSYLLLTKYAEFGWKAGAPYVGITHWKTHYDKVPPGYKQFFEGLLGKYDENKDLWEDRSPLTHIEKLQAPILMIQGVNDLRCPIEESRQFRDKLLELGKKEGEDFEYHELDNQGHQSRDKKQRKTILKLLLDFFERRM